MSFNFLSFLHSIGEALVFISLSFFNQKFHKKKKKKWKISKWKGIQKKEVNQSEKTMVNFSKKTKKKILQEENINGKILFFRE